MHTYAAANRYDSTQATTDPVEPAADIKHILKYHAYLNIPLTFDEAYTLGSYALHGCNGDPLAQVQSIAALSALHTQATYAWKWEKRAEEHHGHALPQSAAEQIAGICAAIFELDIARSEFGFVQPDVPFAMDNSGMGGDMVVTANISSLAAMIASAYGIHMCKHGSPANADKGLYGSSDFVGQICGINVFADKDRVADCLQTLQFGFIEATDTRYKRIHVQTHQIAQLPHMNDIIGPITNPLHPRLLTRRVLGVNQLISPRLIAEAYIILNRRGFTNLQHGMFVRGFVDETRSYGMDEVSICRGGTQVAELREGTIEEYDLHANDFGLSPVTLQDVIPVGNKGDFSLAILKRKFGNSGRYNTVLANAALLFYLAGEAGSLPEGYKLAFDTYHSEDGDGRVYRHVLKIRDFLSR